MSIYMGYINYLQLCSEINEPTTSIYYCWLCTNIMYVEEI